MLKNLSFVYNNDVHLWSLFLQEFCVACVDQHAYHRVDEQVSLSENVEKKLSFVYVYLKVFFNFIIL